jgi:hypothetical protein
VAIALQGPQVVFPGAGDGELGRHPAHVVHCLVIVPARRSSAISCRFTKRATELAPGCGPAAARLGHPADDHRLLPVAGAFLDALAL